MNVKEAAKARGVSEGRIRKLISDGRLKSTKNEHGHHVIDPADLGAFGDRSGESLPIPERMRVLEDRVDVLERQFLEAPRDSQLTPGEDQRDNGPDPEDMIEVAEEPEPEPEPEPVVMTAPLLMGSLRELFSEPRRWAKGDMALKATPDTSLPNGVRYSVVSPDSEDVTAFSLPGALHAYGRTTPEAVLGLAAGYIHEAAVAWWIQVYADTPFPSTLQELNNVLNHTQLLSILEVAEAAAESAHA